MIYPKPIQRIIFKYTWSNNKKALYIFLEERRLMEQWGDNSIKLKVKTVKWLCDMLNPKKEHFRKSNLTQFLFQNNLSVVKYLMKRFQITPKDLRLSFAQYCNYAYSHGGLLGHIKYFDSLGYRRLGIEWILSKSIGVEEMKYVCDEYDIDIDWIRKNKYTDLYIWGIYHPGGGVFWCMEGYTKKYLIERYKLSGSNDPAFDPPVRRVLPPGW